MPLQIAQDFIPMCPPLCQGVLKSEQQPVCLVCIMSLLTHFLDKEHLSGNSPPAIGDVTLGLPKVFPFKSRVGPGRTPTGWSAR